MKLLCVYTRGHFSRMPYKDIAPFPKQMTIVAGLCVVGLMAFGLALSYYKNILFDRQLIEMQTRNRELKKHIDGEYGRLEYLISAQYKDKYAKENIGLVNKGEKVLIITHKATPSDIVKHIELTPEERQALYEENLRNIRILDHWKLYLFNHDQIQALRGES